MTAPFIGSPALPRDDRPHRAREYRARRSPAPSAACPRRLHALADVPWSFPILAQEMEAMLESARLRPPRTEGAL